MHKKEQERLRRLRINAVSDAYGVSLTVAERMVADWYRGRRNKGRVMANQAITNAGLLEVP